MTIEWPSLVQEMGQMRQSLDLLNRGRFEAVLNCSCNKIGGIPTVKELKHNLIAIIKARAFPVGIFTVSELLE
jgi:hypothetical protein